MKIALIVPCYNEEEVLLPFYAEVSSVMAEMKDCSFELLFVDDGSKDKTLEIVKELAEQDGRIKYISFSRNFGKESAMYAGFCNVISGEDKADYIAVMDADLQDPPSLLPEMVKIISDEGVDSVATYRTDRKHESKIRSFLSRRFYKIINKVSDEKIKSGARDFRLMKCSMVEAIVSMSESSRFTKGIFGWVGFKTYWMPFENHERAAGKSSWKFKKLVGYAVDGIVDFSTAPLKVSMWLGVLFFLGFVGMLAYAIVNTAAFSQPFLGWEFGISILCLIAFCVCLCLYMHGLYLSRILLEVKGRPHYIVSETNIKDVVSK